MTDRIEELMGDLRMLRERYGLITIECEFRAPGGTLMRLAIGERSLDLRMLPGQEADE